MKHGNSSNHQETDTCICDPGWSYRGDMKQALGAICDVHITSVRAMWCIVLVLSIFLLVITQAELRDLYRRTAMARHTRSGSKSIATRVQAWIAALFAVAEIALSIIKIIDPELSVGHDRATTLLFAVSFCICFFPAILSTRILMLTALNPLLHIDKDPRMARLIRRCTYLTVFQATLSGSLALISVFQLLAYENDYTGPDEFNIFVFLYFFILALLLVTLKYTRYSVLTALLDMLSSASCIQSAPVVQLPISIPRVQRCCRCQGATKRLIEFAGSRSSGEMTLMTIPNEGEDASIRGIKAVHARFTRLRAFHTRQVVSAILICLVTSIWPFFQSKVPYVVAFRAIQSLLVLVKIFTATGRAGRGVVEAIQELVLMLGTSFAAAVYCRTTTSEPIYEENVAHSISEKSELANLSSENQSEAYSLYLANSFSQNTAGIEMKSDIKAPEGPIPTSNLSPSSSNLSPSSSSSSSQLQSLIRQRCSASSSIAPSPAGDEGIQHTETALVPDTRSGPRE